MNAKKQNTDYRLPEQDYNFKVGEMVIEPSIGICEIKGKTLLNIDNKQEEFYIFHSGTAKVMIPKSQLKRRGIRRPIGPKEIKKVYKILSDYEEINRDVSRQQYINDMNTLKRGNVLEIARLMRTLHTVELSAELKGKEKEILSNARKAVAEELVFVTQKSKVAIGKEIDKSLAEIAKKKQEAKAKE